jgi:sarcosine oxidase subunit beta
LLKAEVVVVGGGSTGASVAFHLAKAEQRNVILLEKDFLGFGATGRTAGIVRCHYPHRETTKMALKSLEFFENFEQVVGGRSGFTKTGLLVIVSESDESKLRKITEMQRDVGVDVKGPLSKDEILQIQPHFALQDIVAGSWEPRAGYADSSAIVTSLASEAEKMGVKVLQKTKVTGVNLSAGRIESLMTDKGRIDTKKVVCATGAWSQQIGEMISTKFPIKRRRSKVALIKRPLDFGRTHPIIFDVPGPDTYYRPDGEKTIVGGAAATPANASVDPDKFNEALEPDETRSFISKAIRRFPIFEKAFYVGGWAGISDDTPDGYPILSELPTVQGFYCAFGMSGHGFKLAPMMGKAMAELIVDGRSKDFNLEEYRYSRFEEGSPIKVPLEYSWGQAAPPTAH